MQPIIAGLALAMAITVPGPVNSRAGAQATAPVSATPQSVVKALQDAGYKAELTKDSAGDPLIHSASGGARFSIFFYGCENGTGCGEIQFYAGWTDKISLERINQWNRTHRFGRAYLDDKGEVNIEYDINLEQASIGGALFRNDLDLWTRLMARFQAFVAGKDD